MAEMTTYGEADGNESIVILTIYNRSIGSY